MIGFLRRRRAACAAAGSRSGSAFSLAERLEDRRLLAADLTGTLTTVPASFLPGGRNKVVLRLTNTGDADVRGQTLSFNLLSSADSTLGSGDTQFFNLSKRVS